MLFNSMQFMIFFPVVVLIYYILPPKFRQLWLLISSYYFYACWNAKYIVLIFFSTTITFASGLLLEKIKGNSWNELKKAKYKKLTVAFSFTLNLAVLFYFKYINFAFDILNDIFRITHIELNIPAFDILLPVGISFYTFQALGYTMDVYRGEIQAETNFCQYALFVSFFPQLVAGPIERSGNLLKQLNEPKKFCFEAAREGILLMLWGFFLKIVLADRIAIFVDTIYADYREFPGYYLIVATVLFAFQIYCDFYGYSVIATGTAEILGIHLMENFKAPYLSCSVAEFWRKWHISLTSWFKDYLYIPLGGSRQGKVRKHFNKMVVFLVSGLWHGAEISYVIWGGLNGFYQIIGETLQPIRNKMISLLHLNRNSMGHKILCIAGTFLLVDFSWIFFRADRTMDALGIVRSILTARNPWVLFDGSLYQCGLDSQNFLLLFICLCILIFADFCKTKGIQIRQVILKQDYWFRWLFIAFAVWAILTFGIWGSQYKEANFIYFQF